MEVDSSNFMIAIVGYIIVFTALLFLYIVFNNIPKVIKFFVRLSLKKDKTSEDCDKCGEFVTGVENAAIATALYMYFNEMHDEENTVITIKKVRKDYSPWSSRVHSINTFQR